MRDIPWYPNYVAGLATIPTLTGNSLPPNPAVPASVVPAKRDDDEVQFVSSNPVKKRRVDEAQCSPQPSQIPSQHSETSNPPTSVPTAANKSEAHTTDQAPKTSHSEHKISVGAGTYSQAPGSGMDWEQQLRGGSVPVSEKSFFPDCDMLWTAPPAGPRSSPALSPKQLPEHISPALLRAAPLEQTVFPMRENGSSQNPPTAPPEDRVFPPESTTTKGVAAPLATMELSTDEKPAPLDQLSASAAGADAKLPTDTGHTKETPGAPLAQPAAVDAGRPSQQQVQDPGNTAGTADQVPEPHATGTRYPGAAPALRPGLGEAMNHEKGLRQTAASNVTTTTAAALSMVPQWPSPAPASAMPPGTQHRTSSGENCGGGESKSPSKKPCRKCLEERLRKQAAVLGVPILDSPAVGVTPVQAGFSPFITPQWPAPLNMATFPNQFGTAAPYGQVQQQQPHQHMLSSFQGHRPMQPPQNSPNMSQLPQMFVGPSSAAAPHPALPMAAQPPTSQGSRPGPTSHPVASTTTHTSTSQQAPTQPNGKHVVVDIAETCLEIFPFEEVARRQNQPVQKIRDLFNAVIQVPLLRCPTDKRRAGKLGTARVKEYNQARKELQSTNTENKHTKLAGSQGHAQQQPSPQSIARYLGSSDVRLSQYPQFTGPW